jgi:uncharacterized OsmC-like protein
MSDETQFSLTLNRITKYQFETRFDNDQLAPLLLDEPVPLGDDKGPNASRLVGAAVGDCLSASLLFCLEKAKQQVNGIKTDVVGTMRRNEKGRWRIAQLDVRITLDVVADQAQRVSRCLNLFEDYCVVTASVRKGILVNVVVLDPQGNELFKQGSPEVTEEAQ